LSLFPSPSSTSCTYSCTSHAVAPPIPFYQAPPALILCLLCQSCHLWHFTKWPPHQCPHPPHQSGNPWCHHPSSSRPIPLVEDHQFSTTPGPCTAIPGSLSVSQWSHYQQYMWANRALLMKTLRLPNQTSSPPGPIEAIPFYCQLYHGI